MDDVVPRGSEALDISYRDYIKTEAGETSEETYGLEERAQTAVQAVIDLFNLYNRDYTSVILVPEEEIEGLYYASASFAADGMGPTGMTGSAPANPFYWKVQSSERVFTSQELAVSRLWFEKMDDFPQRDPVSSCSYDEEALRQYIADTLNISYAEVQMPELKMREHILDQAFIDWTISLATNRISGNPRTEIALESLHVSGNLGDSEKAVINALLNEIPEKIKSQFLMKYEAAEQVSRDSHWMVFSSWRPYTQSSEYQQLLEFCQGEGQAVWPLLFKQLDSESSHFAGGSSS